MFEINYEDFKKFHISLGLWIMVASFITLNIALLASYDRLNELTSKWYNTNENEQNLIEIKLTMIAKLFENAYFFSKRLLIFGASMFTLGYSVFIYESISNYFKKKR